MGLYYFQLFSYLLVILGGGSGLWLLIHLRAFVLLDLCCLSAVIVGCWESQKVLRILRQLKGEGITEVPQPVSVRYLASVMIVVGIMTLVVIRYVEQH